MNFDNIYNKHYSKVFNWINYKINNHEAAEELAADIFIKVHKNLNDYNEKKASMNTWIMSITKNAIIDYFRTNKDRKNVSISNMVDEEGHELFVHSDYSNPETNFQNNELSTKIKDAIHSLPENYSKIAEMFLLKELSHEEISKSLNLPLGTVKGGIHRAKELLKTKLLNL